MLPNPARSRAMGRIFGTLLAAALLCLPAVSAHADDDAKDKAAAPLLEGSVALQMGFGGDAIGMVVSEAGSYELNAGDGSGISMGLAILPYRSGKNAAGIALDAGYMRGRVVADNGSIDTNRIPLSLVAQFHRQSSKTLRWQFGLGAIYHHGVTIDAKVNGFTNSYELDSSIGLRASVGLQWYSTPKYGIELDLYHESLRHELAEGTLDQSAASTGLSARFLFNLL